MGVSIGGKLLSRLTGDIKFSAVQLLSHVRLFVTLWTAACQSSLFITNSRSLLKFMAIESVMPSNHLILCHPLLLPSISPSIGVFSNESVLHIRWPKRFSFSSGLISFRGNLISLQSKGLSRGFSQHHSSKASILWCSAFFTETYTDLYFPWRHIQIYIFPKTGSHFWLPCCLYTLGDIQVYLWSVYGEGTAIGLSQNNVLLSLRQSNIFIKIISWDSVACCAAVFLSPEIYVCFQFL